MTYVPIARDPRYKIDEWGHVKSMRGNIARGGVGKDGCHYVYLAGQGRSFNVSKLVAEAFIPNPEGKELVIHKDGNKRNDAVNNLQWMTRREFQQQLYLEHGRNHNDGVHNKPIKINETGQEFVSITDCAKYLGVDKSAVRQQLNGTTKRCKGYTFSLLQNYISRED